MILTMGAKRPPFHQKVVIFTKLGSFHILGEIMIFGEIYGIHENHHIFKIIMKFHGFTVILHFWAPRDPQIPMEFLREY